MPKASAAKKPAAKPAARQTSTASRATAAPSRAAQAAQAQGRPVPAEPKRSEPAQRSNVPAPRQQARPPMDPATVAHLPAHMQSDAGLGTQNISNEDIVIPRLKLMQGLSPELQEFNDLRAGHFFHPAAEFIFDGPFKAVPLYYDKQYILWKPRDMGGGILAHARDGVHWTPSRGSFEVTLDKKDGGKKVKWDLGDGTVAGSGLANWGTMDGSGSDGVPPAATMTYNFLLAFPDEPDLMPAFFSFQRTSIKHGRKFLTKLKTQRAPIFGTVWEFGSDVESNSANQDFFVPTVKGAGLVEDEGLYQQYRAMYGTYVDKGVSIKDIEGMQDEPGNNASEGDAAGTPNY